MTALADIDHFGVAASASDSDVESLLVVLEDLLDRGHVEGALRHVRAVLDDIVTQRCDCTRRSPLTEREAEALRLLGDGAMSQKDIARTLRVSRNTVKSHVKSIYRKLGAHSRSEAIQLGRHLGVVPAAAPAMTTLQHPTRRLVLVDQTRTAR